MRLFTKKLIHILFPGCQKKHTIGDILAIKSSIETGESGLTIVRLV